MTHAPTHAARLAAILLSLAGASAHAARPANLAGTTWTARIDNGTEQLVIQRQGGPGTAGGPDCLMVEGAIGPAPVRGWYCPATGRLHLRHSNMTTGVTVRVIDAHVSTQVIGQPLYLGGTVAVDDAAFGPLGVYNFSAVK
jgi:hypothetical protein